VRPCVNYRFVHVCVLCGLVACGLLPPSGHVLQCLAEVQTALKLGPGLGPPRVGSRAGGPQVAWGHSMPPNNRHITQ